jgi:hypothetical protein
LARELERTIRESCNQSRLLSKRTILALEADNLKISLRKSCLKHFLNKKRHKLKKMKFRDKSLTKKIATSSTY